MIKYIEDNSPALFDESQSEKETDLLWLNIFPWADGGLLSAKTGLTSRHHVQIKAIMSKYLGNRKIDIFERYLAGAEATLTTRDQVALDYALLQLYGGQENVKLVEQGRSGEWDPSTSDFEPIKLAMEQFIAANMDAN